MLRLLLLFLIACDPAETASPDASLDPDTGSKPTCDIQIASDRASLSEGSRLYVDIDAPGGAAVSLAAPTSWRRAESEGRIRLEPAYGSRGSFDLTATATCTDGSVGKSSLAIEVRALSWSSLPIWRVNQGPTAREHPALILDVDDPDRVLLYGGFAFRPQPYTIVDDLWAFDLETETWTALTSTSPPAFAAGRLAPVEGARAVMYGGGSDQSGDQPFVLWRLDYGDAGGSWSSLAPDGAPTGGSSLGSFVYDPGRDRYLSLCGYGYVGIHCDVEAYLPAENRWTYPLIESDVPEGRYGFFTANDQENERIVIWSGGRSSFNGSVNAAQDTWAYELAEDRWVKLLDSGPPGRRNGCSAVDPIGHRFFVWGGTPDARTTSPGLWVLDLDRGEEQWIEVVPEGSVPERSSCSAIYDPNRQRILFGFGNTTGAIYADWQALEL